MELVGETTVVGLEKMKKHVGFVVKGRYELGICWE